MERVRVGAVASSNISLKMKRGGLYKVMNKQLTGGRQSHVVTIKQ